MSALTHTNVYNIYSARLGEFCVSFGSVPPNVSTEANTAVSLTRELHGGYVKHNHDILLTSH